MAIRVGRVIQLSFEPFYIDMERRGVELVDIGLNQVAEAIREGEIHGGPVPLTDSFGMESHATPVAGFCLSAATRSGSNLFYSRMPIEELGGGRIALSDVDPTTVQLLQVLLAKKYKVGAPELVQTSDEHDALVISGDAALRRRRGMRGFSHRYDLGEEWHRFSELPFVFARWMRSSDMEHRDAMLLEDTLYVGLEEGVDSLFHLSDPRENLLMLARDVMEYIIGYRYFVGLSEQKSIDLFRGYRDRVLAS
jgi:chorismate dehydratase